MASGNGGPGPEPRDCNRTQAPPRNCFPHLKFFLQKRLPQKGYPLSRLETVFGQVFGGGGMSNFQNPKVPPTGGSHLPPHIQGYANLARSRETCPAKARCIGRCAGCSCDRDSAARR